MTQVTYEDTHEDRGDTHEEVDDYCYNCGHEHDNPSHGNWPAEGCSDYEEQPMNCTHCGDTVATARWAIGRHTCMPCGEMQATQERKGWTVCPMPKSNYILITDLSLLKGLNTSHKGGTTT